MLSSQAKSNLIFGFLFFLVLTNLFILNWRLFSPQNFPKKEKELIEPTKKESIGDKADEDDGGKAVCSISCLEIIEQATQSASKSSSVSIPCSCPVASSSRGQTQEFFISLGGTETRTKDWADLIGLEAYVDRSKYGRIIKAVFEVGLSIPNGNQIVWVRLYNVTDGWPVTNSELSLASGTPKFLVSEPLDLPAGNKLYRVQIKTQLGDLAILTQSKIKITAQID